MRSLETFCGRDPEVSSTKSVSGSMAHNLYVLTATNGVNCRCCHAVYQRYA